MHHLTSHSTPCCSTTKRSLCDHRLLWRHFSLCIQLSVIPSLSWSVTICSYLQLNSPWSGWSGSQFAGISHRVTKCREWYRDKRTYEKALSEFRPPLFYSISFHWFTTDSLCTLCLKNVPPLTWYNNHTDHPIATLFLAEVLLRT